MTRIIAVTNQKGGVGKTTTTINLGASLARMHRRVLLVDLDPQANATVGCGVDRDNLSGSSYQFLLDACTLREARKLNSVGSRETTTIVCARRWETKQGTTTSL